MITNMYLYRSLIPRSDEGEKTQSLSTAHLFYVPVARPLSVNCSDASGHRAKRQRTILTTNIRHPQMWDIRHSVVIGYLTN